MRTILITGCTSGFGKLLVQLFLQNGDQVIATGRKLTERKEVLQKERDQFGAKLIELDLDVTVPEQRQRIRSQISKIDILINNAGYGLCGALEDTDEKQIRDQMEVNFFGTVLMTQECLPLVRASKGMIFNFSSGFGILGFPLTSLYCASKFAVEGFSEALSHELSPHGVQVCLIEPGAYRTQFGAKMLWGSQSENPQSPYALQTHNYRKLQKKFITKDNPQNPMEVAEKILKLSMKKNLPMRFRSGNDVRASYWVKRLTPSQTFHKMSQRLYKKILLREKP